MVAGHALDATLTTFEGIYADLLGRRERHLRVA
jgi:hypothetical protein